jgi:tripartite-type tricarboxylate transporter receptor subunit TctC
LKLFACSVAPALLLCALLTLPARAQTATQATSTGAGLSYPTKPIRLIVGFVAGGGTDRISRVLGRKLSDSLGQQIIVDNRAGSAGLVGAVIAAKAPPDGYTLFVGSISALATNVSMYSKLPYDPLRDFAPVTLTMMSPYLLLVNPSMPAATLKEFIALAKATPGKLNCGSAGSGGGNHLAQEMFKFMAGIDIVHVPYKGGGDQLTALIAGQVHATFNLVPTAMPQVRAGRVRALGITSAQRMAMLAEVPTLAESGVPGYEATSWQGVVAPAGTPRAIIDRLYGEIAKALRSAEVTEWLAAEGSTAGGITPEAFAVHIRSEIEKWAKVVKLSGAKAN